MTAPENPACVPRIAIVSLSKIADDPRVRRQGDSFTLAGWDVIAIGLPGARSSPPVWRLVSPETIPDDPSGTFQRIKRALFSLRAWSGRDAALLAYWARSVVASIYATAEEHSADVWLANDWSALPIAAVLAKRDGAILGYDTHEFAVEEFSESLRWRLLHQKLTSEVERHFLPEATIVSTVSGGIAKALYEHYRMPALPMVVRNVPRFSRCEFRPTGSSIRILYHGLLSPGRGLDNVIDSVSHWNPNITLHLRGPGPDGYIALLGQRIARNGVGSRIKILPAIPMTELVSAASEFDVGLVTLPASSLNNRHALPNKLFEYAMAGLALCVSSLPDMRELVTHHDIGVAFDGGSPHKIAQAVNALTPALVDRFKRNALEAAKLLCWEQESRAFVTAYQTSLAMHSRAA